MPNAKCVNCGAEVRWHNYRGAKLADQKCPSCGGSLKPKWWSPEKMQFKKIKQKCIDRIPDAKIWWADKCRRLPYTSEYVGDTYSFCNASNCPIIREMGTPRTPILEAR